MSHLILHGIGNHRPPAHWQFQLAAALAGAGHAVHYPGLPEPDAPSFAEWSGVLVAHLRATPVHTVVCHSLACLLWLKAAPALPRTVDRLLLVSPPADDRVPSAGASFRLGGQHVEDPRARSVRIVRSDNDPYNPHGLLPVDAPVELLPGAGHITPADGYGRWPAVEDWCLQAMPAVLSSS